MPAAAGSVPLYALVTDVLARALRSGSIPAGAVLLEGPLAELLHSTRTPVRQALHALEAQQLVSRFDGRGFLAGPAGGTPRRLSIDAAMLGLDAAAPVTKTLGWRAIHDSVERDLVHVSVFGRHRINELELARHFGVGRVVARDVLLRLEAVGLVEKDARQRWTVTPLDAPRINQLYELRWLLEPAALQAAIAAAPPGSAEPLRLRLRAAMQSYPDVTPAAMDRLEHDLHIGFLAHGANRELLHSLQRTRCILTLSKHVLGASAPMPQSDPFMAEHLAVLDAAAERDGVRGAALLRAHLEASYVKVTERAALVRGSYPKPELPYVG